MSASAELRILHGRIEARVCGVASRAGGWPCRKGCDLCCRRLASAPKLTEAEWLLLRQGLAALDENRRSEIRTRIQLTRGTASPVVCPLLDLRDGSCLIYDQRPVACRTYGFYVERDRGLFCAGIQSAVERGEYRDVVWGNQESIDAALRKFGEPLELADWIDLDSAAAVELFQREGICADGDGLAGSQPGKADARPL
ncbi:MAG: YkgJ family cysteine cluster protein [Bryobacteraceae bacterium]|nr:YkgJ family cysteine cluster protein [Bryobacteraceae bacterium]